MNAVLTSLIAQADRTTVERRFEFEALPEGWSMVLALAAAVVVCWAIVWMYRTEGRRGASMGVRMFLASVRITVMLLLGCILLQPVLATYLHRWIDSYCIVLIDDSASMDLRDLYRVDESAERVRSIMPPGQSFPVRRADIAAGLLSRDDGRFVKELAKRNRVKVYAFSDAPEVVAVLPVAGREGALGESSGTETEGDRDEGTEVRRDGDYWRSRLSAQGASTNVSRAIRRSMESLGGAPLAGVVLLTDGGFNTGDPPQVLGRYVAEQNIPLHVVGIGDAAEPRNVRITEVIAPENAFKDDPFSITAHVTTQGKAGESIRVELYVLSGADDTGGSGTLIESRSVTVRADGVVDPVSFEHRHDELGRFVFRVQVPLGSDESVADDNSKQTVVNVIDDSVRVLVISGSPSWEYRYLSRLLIRDPTFDVSCWLQSADVDAVRDGNTIIDTLPATPEDLFEYDAVILMDPDPSEFGPGWSHSLETLVEDYGGGVAYIASRVHTPQFMRDPAMRRVVRILPITPDPEADLILNRIGHYQTRAWPIEIPPNAASHPILRRGDSQLVGYDAVAEWRKLPGIYWHYPVLRSKPVATVLMRHSNPQMRNSDGGHILLATQFVGSGRTAFIGFDSTWRWRKMGEDVFNTFWVKVLRYLVEGKLLGAKKRATLFTEAETFQLGTAVSVMARLFDARFQPLDADSVDASYAVGSRKQGFVLKRLLDRPGWYEGRFTPPQTGSYGISIEFGSGGSEVVTASHNVQVVRPNIEILNPQMNRSGLLALAEQSAEGRYYEIDEVDEIAAAIPDRHEVTIVRSRPEQLWDRWWTLALLVGLLSLEWAVRKGFRLL